MYTDERIITADNAETFEDFMTASRNDFVQLMLGKYPHEIGKHLPEEKREEYIKWRVGCENILICFDQMREKILSQSQQLVS